jgi:hypothetical protein
LSYLITLASIVTSTCNEKVFALKVAVVSFIVTLETIPLILVKISDVKISSYSSSVSLLYKFWYEFICSCIPALLSASILAFFTASLIT